MHKLDRLLARNLGCSRAQARRLIQGRDDVEVSDDALPLPFELDGRTIELRDEFHLMLNKPAGCVTALRDAQHPTAFACLAAAPLRAELRPVGRLDLDTTGLLLWTTDGALLHRLTHPRTAVSRTYHVALARPFASLQSRDGEAGLCPAEPERGKDWKPSQGFHVTRDGEAGLCPAEPERGKEWKPSQGFHINDLVLRDGHRPNIVDLHEATAAEMHPCLSRSPDARAFASITLADGAYHEVRRIFAALGSHVLSLCRVSFGQVALPHDLPSGDWRALPRSALTPPG